MKELERVKVARRKCNLGGRPSKLSEDQKDILVNHYNSGDTQRELAEEFNISLSTVQKILRSRRE